MAERSDFPQHPCESDWPRLAALLDRLLDLAPAEVRHELDRLAPEDLPLRERAERALAAAAEESGPLARPAAESWALLLAEERAASAAEPSDGLAPGARLGAWRIEGELGRGGMGTVYAVERADGSYEQRAALKLLRGAADDPEARERFQRERQILARLEHPAIARLLDGGVAPDGRPYLVIERVDGVPITAFCDAQRSTLEERLDLFRAVLEAVELAHRNLVVHRDLKPSNILVTAEHAVKLLDFGIAKLLGVGDGVEGDAERTLTRLGTPLTPQYAAPEQVTGGAITTATDVYSLGLVLYELLCGAKPYRVTGESALALARAIADTDPLPPSLAARASPSVAAARKTSPERLARRLAGDLDAIVLQALAKEPERRYTSPADLRADLEAYRAGRPVTARPATLLSRARKFARRHRTGMFAASGLVLALLGGVAALLFALLESRARLAEAERAGAMQSFLLELVSSVEPEQARGREVTLREVVDRGADRLATELAEEPRTRAELQLALGTLYRKLGIYERARPLLDEALVLTRREYGEASPESARVLVQLGELAYWQDDYRQALALQRQALSLFESSGAKGLADVASSRFNVGAALRQLGELEAAAVEERAALELERTLHGESSLDYAEVGAGLTLLLHDLSRDEEALPLAEKVLAVRRDRLGADHPALAAAHENLGLVLSGLGRYDEAMAHLEKSLFDRRRIFGADHPQLLESLNSLASVATSAAAWERARSLREEAVTLARRLYPAGSSSLAINLNNLGVLCYRRHDWACAERALREAVAGWAGSFGEEHPDTQSGRNNLGMALLGLGRSREALVELEAALAGRRRRAGEASTEVAQSLRNVGLARLAGGDRRGARAALDRSVELSRTVYPARHPRLAEALAARAELALAERRADEARRDLEEALAIRDEKLGPDHPLTAETRALLARARL